ncbi:Uncharacterised protein [Bordetella pertussis]|nr:Uncharacterised protein [Bordetella pertussis]CFO74207.1 Uncharacterised protein [Bordetella pertussis]CPI20742.1 Uncharacterised protein [Bordetella pertussis]CPL71062.1 Uncharacterised protein [Bordetella pertussis]CPM02092.1 Uncharacterised protein [Bordetella pertussis]
MRPVGITSVAEEIPYMSPIGVSKAASRTKPTTSPCISKSSPGLRSRHTSPILTIGTTALMIVPTTCTTRPFIRSVDRSCRATRIISVM